MNMTKEEYKKFLENLTDEEFNASIQRVSKAEFDQENPNFDQDQAILKAEKQRRTRSKNKANPMGKKDGEGRAVLDEILLKPVAIRPVDKVFKLLFPLHKLVWGNFCIIRPIMTHKRGNRDEMGIFTGKRIGHPLVALWPVQRIVRPEVLVEF